MRFYPFNHTYTMAILIISFTYINVSRTEPMHRGVREEDKMFCENYDPCFPDQPVVDLYLSIWAKQPSFRSKPAFIWAEDTPMGPTWASITYSHLNSSVQAMASNLLIPLQRGDTVLLLCSPGLRLVKTLFASQRAGLVAVPIIPPDPSSFSSPKPTHHHHHLLRVLSQIHPKAVVADTNYISAVRCSTSKSPFNPLSHLLHNLRWLSVDDLEDEYPHGPTSEYLGCKKEDTYLIQYTSGATGTPKPVLVTAGAAAHNVRAARRAYDLQPSSVIVSWLPQYHDCGLMFLLLAVVAGATCVITSPTAFLNRPRFWLELVTEFKATCTPVPSFALPLVVKRGGVEHGKLPLRLGSLRNLILINEPIYKAPIDEFIQEFARVGLNPSSISPSYGLAENCTFVSTAWCDGSSGDSGRFPNMPSYKKLLPSARLASSDDGEEIEIVVVDEETGEPVKDGVEGEIWVSSPSNASGYLGYPALTREVFNGRLNDRLGRCFVKTGDRGIVRGEDRYLYVMGRSSDAIRARTCRPIHPHYLETAAHNSRPEQLRGGCIAAFEMAVSPSKSAIMVVAELQKKGGGMGVYKILCEGIREQVYKEEGVGIGVVVLVERGSIPKTTSGKLRRWAAREKLVAGSFPVVYEVRFKEEEEEEAGHGELVWRREEVGSDGEVPVVSVASATRRVSLLSFL